MKEMPNLICGNVAVGRNYNSTHDTVMILHAFARIVTVRHKTTLMVIYKVYPPMLSKNGRLLKYITAKGNKI